MDVTIDTAAGPVHGTITGLPDQEIDTRAIRERLAALTGFPPGPWRVAADHPLNACVRIRADFYEVATLYSGGEYVATPEEGEPWGPHPVRDATAQLIAAAPDLLALAHSLLDVIDARKGGA